MKEERTAGLLVSETFCLALVSDTFGCNKALGAIEQAYTMLFNMDERGKNCWATSVRNILFSLVSDTFGFNKALGAIEQASQYLSKDLQIYIYKQKWSASILQKDTYAKYRDFKTFVESER